MKLRKLAIVVVGSLVFLFGVAFAAWAGGAAGAYACCVVDNPGGGAIALQGTVTVVYSPSPLNYSDVKLRLERGGKFGFFELHLQFDYDVSGIDNFEWMCLILNPNEPPSATNQNAVNALVNEILTFFFPGAGLNPTNTSLVITRKSITLTDGNVGGGIPGTDRLAAIADVVVYAVNTANARFEYNPNCR
jgi:hypothetical protein